MLVGVQPNLGQNWVRFGNPGDPDVVAPMALDAAQVIADLRPMIAPPPTRR